MRLTEPTGKYSYWVQEWTNEYEAVDKLGRLEDIEEDVKIGIDKVFDAVKNGIYYINENGVVRFAKVSFQYDCDGQPILIEVSKNSLLLKVKSGQNPVVIQLTNEHHRYGKFWALTKEELK